MGYLDEDVLYNIVEEMYKVAKGEARAAYSDVLDTICEMPRADVAPRAEVEKLQEVNADLNESLRLAAEANKDLQAEVDRLRFNLKAVLDERAEDKAEVAREIFEELDKKIFHHIPDLYTFEIYTELKKKYTEDK